MEEPVVLFWLWLLCYQMWWGSDSSSSDSLVPHFRGHLGIHLTWYFFHPENGFSGFLDPKNVGKDIKFITPRQTQMELYWM